MKPLTKVLILICVLGLGFGLADVGNSMFSGMARAVGAVFFILSFVSRIDELASAEEMKSQKQAPARMQNHAPGHMLGAAHSAS